ncbi:MAG: CorA family divalent cation transporter [Bdellovibrio sp.]
MKRFEHAWQDFRWIDIEAPTQEDYVSLAEEFELPLNLLVGSMDPSHLPKAEFLQNCTFFILRHFDKENAKDKSGSLQELTTKLVFFVGKDYVLTLHRIPLPCITESKDRAAFEQLSMQDLVGRLCLKVLHSFEEPLDELVDKTETIEKRVYSLRRRNILREGYHVKRRASAFKKIFKFTSDVMIKFRQRADFDIVNFDIVAEPLDRLIFDSDSLLEEITGLLNLHLALMSQKTNEASLRTNEVMRVLTVVSIFFLPINFIAGVYGMNFEHMPELKNPNGYYMTLGLMFIIAVAILGWAYAKGWLRKEDF